MTCDQRTGYCNSCVDGYKGNTCEQYTGTLLQKNVDKLNWYYDLHVTYGLYQSVR